MTTPPSNKSEASKVPEAPEAAIKPLSQSDASIKLKTSPFTAVTTPSEWKNPRLVSGIIIAVVITFAAACGGWVWMLLMLGAGYFAYRELMSLFLAKDINPSQSTIVGCCITFFIFALYGLQRHFEIIVTLGLISTFSRLLLRETRASIGDVGGTMIMLFYLGFLPAHFILIRQIGASPNVPFWLEPGLAYLFLILLIVSTADIVAYYAGKKFGKNLLSPQISPKKTIEGFISGFFGAVIAAIIFTMITGIPVLHGIVLGMILSVVAQVGDLSESLLKRDAGIKDSSSLIPGHGGILDRTDSYIFAGAVGYYYILWFILHKGLAADVIRVLENLNLM